MRHRRLTSLIILAFIAMAAPVSQGVVYLADHSLEGLIVEADVIATGKVVRLSDATATLAVGASLAGDAKGELTIHAAGKGAPRLSQGQRAVVFLSRKDGKHILLARMPLRSDAEEKTMIACYAEVKPHAALLHGLADAKKEVDAEKIGAAVNDLAASKNAFTQIILGRLMEGPLTEHVEADGCIPAIEAGLGSKHVELVRGAARWASKAKDRRLLPPLKAALEHKDPRVKKYAGEAIKAIESAPANSPGTQP